MCEVKKTLVTWPVLTPLLNHHECASEKFCPDLSPVSKALSFACSFPAPVHFLIIIYMFCTIITHEEGYFQLLPCNKGSLQQIVLHRWSGRFLHQMPGVLFLWLKPNHQSFTWQANVWTTTLQRHLFHSFIYVCLYLFFFYYYFIE